MPGQHPSASDPAGQAGQPHQHHQSGTPDTAPVGPQPGNPTVWVTPSDPDRYAREQTQLAREALAASQAATRRSNRIAIALGILASILAGAALYPQFRSDAREQGEVDDKERTEAGSPLKLTPYDSFNLSGRWVTDGGLGDDHEGEVFDDQVYDFEKPSFAWLYKNWTPLNYTSVAVNALSVHEKTSLIQGVEISKLKCSVPKSRTLLTVPGVGSGGELTRPAEYAVEVEESKPVLRELANGLPGRPAKFNVTLEQGDQRPIMITFFSSKRSCEFEASLKVSSNGKTHRVRLPSLWGYDNKPAGYTFRISAPPEDYNYRTYYVVEKEAPIGERPHIVRVPRDHIVWQENGQPEYVGPV